MARFGYYRAGGMFRRGGSVGGKLYSSVRVGTRVSRTTGKTYTAYQTVGKVSSSRHSTGVAGRSVNKAMNSIYGACSGYDHQASPEANKVAGIIGIAFMALFPIVLLIALAYCGLL